MKKKNIIITIIMIILLAIACVVLSGGCVKIEQAELDKREATKEALKAEKKAKRAEEKAKKEREATAYFTVDSLGGTVLEKNYTCPTLIVYATQKSEERSVALVIVVNRSSSEYIGGILEAASKEFKPGMAISMKKDNGIFNNDYDYGPAGGRRAIYCILPSQIAIERQDGSMTSSLEIPASTDAKNQRP